MRQQPKHSQVILQISMAINIRNNKGFSLVEMLIYVTLLATILLLVINTVLSFSSSYRQLAALRAAEHSGIDAMERITRDIRQASSADTSIAGALTLVATSNSVSTTTRFYVQNNVLNVDINGTYYGPLTTSNASVTNITFTLLTNSTSKAVKVDMTVQGISGTVTKTKTYHSTIVLKGS